MTSNKIRLFSIFFFAFMAVAALYVGAPLATAQETVRAAGADKLRGIAQDQERFRKLLFEEVYGGAAGGFSLDDVSFEFVIVDDVTVVGTSYTLIFVGTDDILGWDTYKPYLPPMVAQAPASGAPADEQIVTYVARLADVAQKNFYGAFEQDFQQHKASYAQEFPDNFVESDVRSSIEYRYHFNQNLEARPDIQRLYNEYAALKTLQGALELYMTMRSKL